MNRTCTTHPVTHHTSTCLRAVMLSLALFVIAVCAAHAEQPTASVSFAQVSFTASNPPVKYSHYGQVSVDFMMLYGEGYINVERYQNGQPAGWVVKNLPVIGGSVLSGFSTMFDLGSSGYQPSFSAYVDFSPTPLADDSALKNQTPLTYQLAQAEYFVAPPNDPPGTKPQITISGGAATVDPRNGCKQSEKDAQLYTFDKDKFTKTIEVDGKLTFCALNASGKKWTGLAFKGDVDQKVDVHGIDAGEYFQIKGNPKEDHFGVAWSGVNDNHLGILNNRTFLVIIENLLGTTRKDGKRRDPDTVTITATPE